MFCVPRDVPCGSTPTLLITTVADSKAAAFCGFLGPGWKAGAGGAGIPKEQPCFGACADTVDGLTSCAARRALALGLDAARAVGSLALPENV